VGIVCLLTKGHGGDVHIWQDMRADFHGLLRGSTYMAFVPHRKHMPLHSLITGIALHSIYVDDVLAGSTSKTVLDIMGIYLLFICR
jgi:hypothetical protein